MLAYVLVLAIFAAGGCSEDAGSVRADNLAQNDANVGPNGGYAFEASNGATKVAGLARWELVGEQLDAVTVMGLSATDGQLLSLEVAFDFEALASLQDTRDAAANVSAINAAFERVALRSSAPFIGNAAGPEAGVVPAAGAEPYTFAQKVELLAALEQDMIAAGYIAERSAPVASTPSTKVSPVQRGTAEPLARSAGLLTKSRGVGALLSVAPNSLPEGFTAIDDEPVHTGGMKKGTRRWNPWGFGLSAIVGAGVAAMACVPAAAAVGATAGCTAGAVLSAIPSAGLGTLAMIPTCILPAIAAQPAAMAGCTTAIVAVAGLVAKSACDASVPVPLSPQACNCASEDSSDNPHAVKRHQGLGTYACVYCPEGTSYRLGEQAGGACVCNNGGHKPAQNAVFEKEGTGRRYALCEDDPGPVEGCTQTQIYRVLDENGDASGLARGCAASQDVCTETRQTSTGDLNGNPVSLPPTDHAFKISASYRLESGSLVGVKWARLPSLVRGSEFYYTYGGGATTCPMEYARYHPNLQSPGAVYAAYRGYVRVRNPTDASEWVLRPHVQEHINRNFQWPGSYQSFASTVQGRSCLFHETAETVAPHWCN